MLQRFLTCYVPHVDLDLVVGGDLEHAVVDSVVDIVVVVADPPRLTLSRGRPGGVSESLPSVQGIF